MGPFLDFRGFNFDKLEDNLYLYTGVFLSEVSRRWLLETFHPRHPVLFADHVTLSFKPTLEEVKKIKNWYNEFGTKEIGIQIVRHVIDEFAQAVVIRLLDSIPPYCIRNLLHITISCGETIRPSYSNILIEKSGEIITPPSYIILGEVGVCSYIDRQILPEHMWKRRGLYSPIL